MEASVVGRRRSDHPRRALREHDPHALDGCGAEGQLRPSRARRWRWRRSRTCSTRGSWSTRPKHPQWPDRDRFVLSCGHASMLLYSTLYLTGYGLTLDDLKNFRQLGSPTAGHPEYGHAAGIETTTGPARSGHQHRRRHGARRAHAGRALQPRRPRDRRSLHVRDRVRRRPAGGHRLRGVLAGRPPRPRPPDQLLGRQPHLDRGRHRDLLHRGRRRPLRGVRLARPEPRRGHRPRPHRGGAGQCPRRSPTSRR